MRSARRREPNPMKTLVLALALLLAPLTAMADIVINVDQGATAPLAYRNSTIRRRRHRRAYRRGGERRPAAFGPLPAARSGDVQEPRSPTSMFSRPSPAGRRSAPRRCSPAAVAADSDGRLRADFRLWDSYAGEQLLGVQFTSTADNWRRIAHKIADAVYEKLTGAPGYFDTRIAFVAESGPRGARVKRLAIMDQDGANPSYLTDGSFMAFTPRFSANTQELTYMALRPDGSTVYLLNIETDAAGGARPFPGHGVRSAFFSGRTARSRSRWRRAATPTSIVMDLRQPCDHAG